MYNFALIGLAGYIAPRHVKAIHDTGNRLVVALDKSDSVGFIDSSFPDCSFFTEYERFDRFLERVRNTERQIDYLTVCTPNYLHDSHIRTGLRAGANVICEKPLVLNPWNLDSLADMERRTGCKVNTILQLRLHPSILALHNQVKNAPDDHIYNVDLSYITSRGKWYYASWKGDEEKSGGVATNIGIHFIDMLQWIFGPVEQNIVHLRSHDRTAGFLHLKRARVRYFLSINAATLPPDAVQAGKRTFRQITVDGKAFEFSDGFTELHTRSYEQILQGNGFSLDDARPCIETASQIRNAHPVGLVGDYHPFCLLEQCPHPFVHQA